MRAIMTNEERIQMIQEAQELIEQAMQMVDDAVNGTSMEAHYYVYGKYGFNQLMGNGNPYDSSLNTLIEEFENEEEDEEITGLDKIYQ